MPTDSNQALTVHGKKAHADHYDGGQDDAKASANFRDDAIHLFRKAMAQTRMAVCLSDPTAEDTPIVFANNAFLQLTGYPDEEVIGRNCRFLQGPETDRDTVRRMGRALEEEEVVVMEVLNYRKDGSKFWNALHLGPLYDEDGKLQYYFGSQWDVTDVHAARAGEQHAKLMARELSHRVKNMFSIVTSVVTMTGRHERTPGIAAKINDRVHALGRAYEATLDDAVGRKIAFRPLVETVLGPYGSLEGAEPRIRLTGGDVTLDASSISTLGLVLHELATNAVKYGALRNEAGSPDAPRGGHVDLDWRTEASGEELVLVWSEHGGPPVSPPPEGRRAGSGMGSGIVDKLVSATGGTIEREWKVEGLVATLRLPTTL